MNKVIFRLLSATLLLAGCSDKPEQKTGEKVIPVKTLHIVSAATTGERSYIGTVEESFALSLSFSGMGTVEQVFVSEGQKVSKGQLLATLNTATVQNTVDVSLASLRQAQDAYDRLSKLHDSGSLPDIKFVEVETGLQQAKSMLAVSEKNLADCRLYAPRAGVIAERSIEPGANAMPGMAAFKLITVDEIDARIAVPENEIGSIFLKQEALIEATALGGERFTGKIETKGVAAHPLTHTYEVKIRVDNHVGAKNISPSSPDTDGAKYFSPLLPGMVCKVYIKQPDTAAGIVIPNRTVQVSHDGRHFVWIADGSTARRRFVKPGALNDSGVTIAEGLTDGDLLIVEGYTKVSEGMKISMTN